MFTNYKESQKAKAVAHGTWDAQRRAQEAARMERAARQRQFNDNADLVVAVVAHGMNRVLYYVAIGAALGLGASLFL